MRERARDPLRSVLLGGLRGVALVDQLPGIEGLCAGILPAEARLHLDPIPDRDVIQRDLPVAVDVGDPELRSREIELHVLADQIGFLTCRLPFSTATSPEPPKVPLNT